MYTHFAGSQPVAHPFFVQAQRHGGGLLGGVAIVLAVLLGAPAPAHAQGCVAAVTVTDAAERGANTLHQALVDVCDGGTITLQPGLGVTPISHTVAIAGNGAVISNTNATGLRFVSVDAASTSTSTAGDYHTTMTAPGNALQFNGSGSYVAAPNAAALNFPGAFTLEAWVYKASPFSGAPGIISKGDYFLVGQSGTDQITFGFVDSSTTPHTIDSLSAIPNNQWVHLAGVYDGADLLIYRDGVLDNRATIGAFTVATTSANLELGKNAGDYFNGTLDEVRLWNLARTQTTLQRALYYTLTGSEPGLAAYYDFDQTAGTTLPDLTSNGNHGTLINLPTWASATWQYGYPFVTTGAATDISTTVAAVGGTLVDEGLATVTASGVCYAVSATPTTPCTTDGGLTAGAIFTSSLAGLSPNTLYAARVYASNSFGLSYGRAITFTTACVPAVTVQNNADGGAGSLRQALISVCPGGAIDFAAGMSGGVIALESGLVISKSVTITSSVPITLSGGGSVRIFAVNAGAEATLAGLTLDRGDAADSGGALLNAGVLTVTHSSVRNSTAGNGGGFYNEGVLYVHDSALEGNIATDPIGGGGAIFNTGVLTVTGSRLAGNSGEFGAGLVNLGGAGFVQRSTFTNNLANTGGAGIYNSEGALIIEQCTFSGNATGTDAGAYGGALVTDGGALSVERTTFAGNRAFNGGGVYLMGTGVAAIHNSTLSGNTATNSGGGVYNENSLPVALLNNTLTGNGAANSGGVQNYGTLHITNTVIANSTGGGDCRNGDPTNGFQIGVIGANARNLFASTTVTDTCGIANAVGGSLVGVDPQLGALADNGGDTQTHALPAGSPAIDAGDADSCALSPVSGVDQRGVARPQPAGGRCDIGAYEAPPMPFVALTKQVTPTVNVPYQGVVTYTLTLRNRGNLTDTATLTDALPAGVAFGSWMANPGAGETDNLIAWQGDIAPASVLTFTFTATHTAAANLTVTNTASFSGALQAGQATAAFTTIQANTATALASDPNPAFAGQPVVFTATVTAIPPGTNLPSGVVTFTTGASASTAPLVSGVATITTSSLAAGSHLVTATYGGDANFVASSAALTQTVDQNGTTLAVISAPNASAFGQLATFTVTVAPTTTTTLTPAGWVTLTVNGQDYPQEVTGRVTIFGFSALEPGVYTATANYGGDVAFLGSVAGEVTHTVARSAVATTLASAPAPATYGQAVSVPVTVTALHSLPPGNNGVQKGVAAPTGVITLYAGIDLVTSALLVDGLATLNLPLPAGGVHTLTVLYGGDDRYVHDQATTLLVVNRAATTSTLSSPPAPTVYGQPAIFTATVAALPLQAQGGGPQPALPSGQVQLYEGQTVLASGDLSAGAAHFTVPMLSSGMHTFTALYLGDGNYLTSTAATTHTIQPQPTAVNDAAGVLEGAAVDVAVLANDHDPAGGGLTVVAVTQPARGAASIDPGGQTVHYAATAAGRGVVSFTYTLQDANGQQSTGLVAIVVTARAETDAPPQLAPVDPTVAATVPFTSSQATVTVALPAGFYTGTVGPAQLFFLSYTPIVTPTAPTQTPPPPLQFANFEFELTAFLDDQPLHGVVFAQSVVLTIRYAPALLAGIDPATLALFAWNGSAWTTDGIARVSHDIGSGVLTVALSHLSDFALFGAASPTDLAPEPEPNVNARTLYLPAVMR